MIGNSVTSIGYATFSYCTSLRSVTIPNSVTSIGDEAFYSCASLTNIMIGNSVINIGSAFSYCTSLTAITVDPLNSVYSSMDGVLFNKSQTTLIQCPSGKLGSCTIPVSVTSIRPGAFSHCTSLTAITVDPLNSVYSSVDGVLFNKSQTALIQCPGGKPGSYTVPNSVTNIGDFAFAWCTSLNNVTIGNNVTSIGEAAFDGCTSLTSITIPNSVTSIGEAAFYGCTGLTGVYFQGNAPTVGESAFSGDNATAYYLPGITGWRTTFFGCPTAVWLPQAQTRDASFGVRTNRFGFNINWASGRVVVVEACSLANPIWVPLQTNTLTGGSCYFGDPDWTNYPARCYRLRSP